MRIIMLILTLVVCFLAGVLYGVDSKQPLHVNSVEQETEIEMESTIQEMSQEVPEETVTLVQTATTPAYEAASALKTIVDFFYEIVVDILLHVSKLFF